MLNTDFYRPVRRHGDRVGIYFTNSALKVFLRSVPISFTYFVSGIAVFVLKRNVKLQSTYFLSLFHACAEDNSWRGATENSHGNMVEFQTTSRVDHRSVTRCTAVLTV